VPIAGTSHLLAGLTPPQRSAVVADSYPLCILAGAGSGKTRVLTRRIAYRAATGTADPGHVLAVTFTRRAAGELRHRLGQLGVRDQVAAGTFHGLGLAVLRRWWDERDQRPQSVLDRKVPLIAPLLEPELRSSSGEVACEIEWAQARLIPPERYVAEATSGKRKDPFKSVRTAPFQTVAAVFARYQDQKLQRGLIDFDDILRLASVAIQSDPAFAASQRWRFRHLFVDEYQDVNPLQLSLLNAWRGESLDLCVVGDPNQAIYSWNGADPSELADFSARYPSAATIRLDANFRCSPQVLVAAQAVLRGRPSGLANPMTATQADGPIPTVTSYPTDIDEARSIAVALRARSHLGWSSMAVLTRTNAQLLVLERELRTKSIPFQLRGAGPFMARPEVATLVVGLRNESSRPLRDAKWDLVADGLLDMSEANGDFHVAPNAARLARAGLYRLAEEHLGLDPAATVGGFLAWLSVVMSGSDCEWTQAKGGVELATFHAAKGLEWPVVFLAGIEKGLVPIGHAESQEAKSEEQRLFYVAATRAGRELHCSWAQRRNFGGHESQRAASPYLAALEATIADLAQGGGGENWREHLANSRRGVDSAIQWASPSPRRAVVNPDPAVLAALRMWRKATARASGVPPFVVLHDATLAAMAEAKPQDHESLLALPGVGPIKADRYGQALLAVVATAAAS